MKEIAGEEKAEGWVAEGAEVMMKWSEFKRRLNAQSYEATSFPFGPHYIADMTKADIEARLGFGVWDARPGPGVVSLYFELEESFSKSGTIFGEVRGRIAPDNVIRGGQLHYHRRLPVGA